MPQKAQRAIQPSEELEDFTKGVTKRRKDTAMERMGIRPYTVDDMVGMVPAAGMTRYLKDEVPDVARRVAGTEAFKNTMRAMGSKYEEIGGMFAERYPRIAAHIATGNIMPKHVPKGAAAITRVGRRAAGAMEKTPVIFRRGLLAKDAEEAMLHEGTHVAQELGLASKGGLSHAYGAVDKALKELGHGPNTAYLMNPYEVSARTTASRKLGQKLDPEMVGPRLDFIINQLPKDSPNRAALLKIRGRK